MTGWLPSQRQAAFLLAGFLAGCLAFHALADRCHAGSGQIISLPAAGAKMTAGLRMTVNTRGIDANGYRPIRLIFKPWPPKPLAADRQLRVVLRPSGYNSLGDPEVTQIIELPEGSTSTTATVAIPQSGMWYSVNIKVFEDGALIEELSPPYMNLMTAGNYFDWTEARPGILVVHPAVPTQLVRDPMVQSFRMRGDPNPVYGGVPDIRNLAWTFPDPNRAVPATTGTPIVGNTLSKASDLEILSQVNDLPRLELAEPGELPDRWIELSQYDVIVMSHKELQALAKSSPERLDALRRWAATGPMLVIYGVGEDFGKLGELERLLKLSPVPESKGKPHRGWTPADPKDHLTEVQANFDNGISPIRTYSLAESAALAGEESADLPAGSLLPSSKTTPFVIRPIMLGKVVALAADDPFPGQQTDWVWIFNSVDKRHWMWYQRNGFSLHRENDDYWAFLIPGVGEAPVISFLLLVSLFAILIGPVNYVLLGRAQRLYLLLITVPVGALLVTGSLFTYALLTDGIGVRLRSRSFTEIDQRTGQSVAWSRQSYYASMAPSRGLAFGEDTTVFPIVYQPNTGRGTGGHSRAVTWDEGQILRAGYLQSRSTGQFMVLRSADTTAKLVVTEGKSAGQPPEVKNLLETNVRYLLVRDSHGDFYAAQSLDEGAAARLKPITDQDAASQLAKLLKKDAPQFPRGYDPNVHNNALSMLMPNYSWMNVDTSSSQPTMLSSLLEANVAQSTRPTAFPLSPGSYMAVAERSPVATYGVPRVKEEASLHVIRGRW